MHIQHSQFVALLAEASGIEEEKISKQLEELINEITLAVKEDEAYELEGFGIFSQLGNRLVFIPSAELETEINFKYVGMEPIEMESAPTNADLPEEEPDPFAGLDTEDDEGSSKRDPFSGLIEELDEDEIPDELPDTEDDDLQLSDTDTGSDHDDIFGVGDADEPAGSDEEEEKPGPLQWGISAHKESDDSADRLLSSLMGGSSPDDPMSDPDDAFDDPFAEDDTSDDLTEEAEPEKTEQDDLEEVLNDTDELDDFDDPFATLHDEDEKRASEEELEEEEILPVITNISSDLPEPEKKPKKEKKKKKADKPADEEDKKPAPVWLWALLVVVIAGGAVISLGYLNILQIPGISSATSAPPQQALEPRPAVQVPVMEQNEQNETTTAQEEAVAETVQTPPAQDQQDVTSGNGTPPAEDVTPKEREPQNMPETVPSGQTMYGLTGVATDAANDGYTIVLYSLSIEENAYREQERLRQRGYRALVTPVSSAQYGTLWRVSIGQFATQREAAIATEQLDDSFTQNIFIKKITN